MAKRDRGELGTKPRSYCDGHEAVIEDTDADGEPQVRRHIPDPPVSGPLKVGGHSKPKGYIGRGGRGSARRNPNLESNLRASDRARGVFDSD